MMVKHNGFSRVLWLRDPKNPARSRSNLAKGVCYFDDVEGFIDYRNVPINFFPAVNTSFRLSLKDDVWPVPTKGMGVCVTLKQQLTLKGWEGLGFRARVGWNDKSRYMTIAFLGARECWERNYRRNMELWGCGAPYSNTGGESVGKLMEID